MKSDELNAYFELLESFQSGQTSAEDFEADYLALFKADERLFPENVFEILNKLFSDVDMFVSNPELRREGDLDQNQLLECCREAYRKLEKLMKNT